MTKEISELTAKATPIISDEIEIQETGGGTSKKATLANILNKVVINRTVDVNLDNLLSYSIDNAAGTPVDLVTLNGSDLLTLGDALCVGGVTLVSGGAVNINPAVGSAIVLDGTINVDAGVVTGATSITSTNFYGILTIPNTEYVYGRNAADNADLQLIGLTGADNIEIGSATTNSQTLVRAATVLAGYIGATEHLHIESGEVSVRNSALILDNTRALRGERNAASDVQICTVTTGNVTEFGNLTIATSIISGAAINITPKAGSDIVLDGTIHVDAGVVTGATSITSTVFVGGLTGNADTATTATTATNITVADTADASTYVVLVGNATGGEAPLTDAGITYNATTGTLTATAFSGPLTGNVTGDVTGTAATVTGAAQTAITSVGTLTGLTMGGTVALVDNEITRPILTDYGEKVNAIGSIGGGTQDIDLTLGNVVTGTVDTSTTTFTFSNPTASPNACGFVLVLTNGGSQTVNWPGSVDWAGAVAPTLTASGVDILVFFTFDGGTIWHGVPVSLGSS